MREEIFSFCKMNGNVEPNALATAALVSGAAVGLSPGPRDSVAYPLGSGTGIAASFTGQCRGRLALALPRRVSRRSCAQWAGFW